MGDKFTRQVLYLHEQLAPEFDIESFVDALDPKAIGLSDKSQFYAPVNFSVQICGGINAPAGAITLAVPVHANPQWLDTMKRRFAKMVGMGSVGKRMDFRMVNGQSISTMTGDVDELTRVGKLNFFVDNKLVRLPSMPETPIEYSVTKVPNIQAWYKDMATELPELLADELINKTAVEVDAAIRPDGPVQRRIERHIASTSNAWTEFVRSHHMNSPDAMSDADAKDTLKAIGKEILIEIRRFIAASKPEIDRHIAAVENKKAQKELKAIEGHDSEHYAPLLSVPTTIFAPGKINGLALYRRLVDDALCSPVLERAVVDTVYNKPIAGCRWDKEPFSKDNTDDSDDVVVVHSHKTTPPKAPRPTRTAPAKRVAPTSAKTTKTTTPPPPAAAAGMTVERLPDGRTYLIPARTEGENDAIYKARVAASNPQVPSGADQQWWEGMMTYLTRERAANSASLIQSLAAVAYKPIGADVWTEAKRAMVEATLRKELKEMELDTAFKDSVFATQKSIMSIVGAMECMRLDFVKRKKEEEEAAAAAAAKKASVPAPAPAQVVPTAKGGYVIISTASFPDQLAAAEKKWNAWFASNTEQEGRRAAYQAFKLYVQGSLTQPGVRDKEDSDELDKLLTTSAGRWSHRVNARNVRTEPYSQLFPYLGAALLKINLSDAENGTLERDKTRILNRLHDVRITAGEGAKLLEHIENVEAIEAKKGTEVNSDEEPASAPAKTRKQANPQKNAAGGTTAILAGRGAKKPEREEAYTLKVDKSYLQTRGQWYGTLTRPEGPVATGGDEAFALFSSFVSAMQDKEDGVAHSDLDVLFSKDARANLEDKDKALYDDILQYFAAGFGIHFPPGDAAKSNALEVLRAYMVAHKAEYVPACQEDDSCSSETGSGSESGSEKEEEKEAESSDSEPDSPPPARDAPPQGVDPSSLPPPPVLPPPPSPPASASDDEDANTLAKYFANAKKEGGAQYGKVVTLLKQGVNSSDFKAWLGDQVSLATGKTKSGAEQKKDFPWTNKLALEVVAMSLGCTDEEITAHTQDFVKMSKDDKLVAANGLIGLIKRQVAAGAVPRFPPNLNVKGALMEAHHPWNAFLHHTYRPVAGRYPEYYDRMHTKSDMLPSAAYVGGDAAETHCAYQLYSGTPISPPGYVIGSEVVVQEEEKEETISAPITVAPRTKRVDIRQKMRTKLNVVASKAPARVQEEAEEVDTMIDDEFPGLPTCASFDF